MNVSVSSMRKWRCLLVNLLLILAHNFALSANSAQESDEQPRLATVESRRATVDELFAKRAGLPAGDSVGFIKLTNHIAELRLQLKELETAFSEVSESLKLAKELDDSAATLLADTYLLHGRVQTDKGDYKTAHTSLKDGLELSERLNYLRGQAKAYYYLAINHQHYNNEIDEAKAAINQSVKLWQQLGDKRGEALALRSKGEIYTIGDEPEAAIAAHEMARTMWRELNDPAELSTTLLDLSFIANRQGQWQQSLALLNEVQALAIDKQAEPYIAGQTSMSLGEVYEAYHQLPTALNYFNEGLHHYKTANDVSGSVDARNKVGRVLAQLGYFDDAKRTIAEGLALSEQNQTKLLSGLGHEDLGRVYLTRQLYAEARLEFLKALDYFKPESRPWARTQSYLGQTEYLLGNLATADKAYQRALQTFRDLSDYTNEAALRFGIGKLAFDRGQLDLAETSLRRSIELTERLRDNAASMDLRSSFLGLVHDRYETQVELLMTLHAKHPDRKLDVKAFEVSEHGRARALLDSLRTYRRDLRQVDDLSLLEREETLQKAEQKLVDEKAEQLSRGKTDQATEEIDRKLMDVRAQQDTLQARINTNSRYLEFTQPKPLSLQSIQNELTDDKTSLVEFALGNRQSFGWVVTKNGFTTILLKDKQTIYDAAQRLVKLLSDRPSDADYDIKLQIAIEEVSKLVVTPLAEKLHTERLIIVADGILQYVPFQVLSTSARADEPLIGNFDIVNAPSASTLALMREQRKNRQPASKLVVGFGDAVFSSSSVDTTTDSPNAAVARSAAVIQEGRLPPLFKSQAELRAIRELAGSNESEFYVQYNATRQNLLNIDLGNFKIVHLVTHGIFDERQPELSGLVLSLRDANQQPVNGYVGLADIYKLHAPVDLVVLSACNSALGPEVRGEGLTGLTRGFTYAGASSIVASFWNVDDEAGSELMKQFYTNLLQRSMSPAAALRAAQNDIRKRPEWRSPYFWAGFTFQGDFDQRITVSASIPTQRNRLVMATGVLAVLGIGAAYWLFRRRSRQQH
jgi:CHAT domain-containing protein